jgi:hypothetical protein
MEMVGNAGVVLGVLLSLTGIFKFVKDWILTPVEDQQKVLGRLKKWFTTTTLILATLCSFAISAFCIWQVVEFGLSTAPLTRQAVLLLIACLWNAVAYTGFGLAIPAMVKAIRVREAMYNIEAQT